MIKKHIRAFFLGMREFRSSYTTHIHDYRLHDSYDRGRELAHLLTLRRFEQA